MIEIILPLITLLIAEFVGDFLLQDREMALKKSSDLKFLAKHLFAIFVVMAATGLGFGMPSVYLAGCYVIIHGIQDWYIWNGYKYLVGKRLMKEVKDDLSKLVTNDKEQELFQARVSSFEASREYAEDKVFYDTIGLDRVLHIVTIVVLYGVFFL